MKGLNTVNTITLDAPKQRATSAALPQVEPATAADRAAQGKSIGTAAERADALSSIDAAEVHERPNLHRATADLGYSVLPILPACGNFAVGVPKSAYGKAPGRFSDGYWFLLPKWNTLAATPVDLNEWHAKGAGVGIRPDHDGLFVDVDCEPEDRSSASIIDECFIEVFGKDTPCRFGNGERRTYFLRLEAPRQSEEVPYDGGKIELRTGTEQVVAYGMHPKTMKPYHWSVPLCARIKLPAATEAKIKQFKELLAARLPEVKASARSIGNVVRAAETLKVDPKKIAVLIEAIDTLPNDETVGRREWVATAHAIKAASIDCPGTGEECWERHSEKYPGNDPDETARVWDTMRLETGFRVGVQDILRWADGGKFGKFSIRYWFEPVEPAAEEGVISDNQSDWMDLSKKLDGYKPRLREFVVDGWVPSNEVTLFYGDGGTGKTLLGQQLGTCVSLGIHWLGQPTLKSRVMGFFCEDSADELLLRQSDINPSLGITHSDLGDFRIASRRHKDNILALWDRGTGAMKLQPTWYQLRDDAIEFGAKLLILDTIADLFAGNEIDRAQVNAFVKSCLGRLAQEIGGTVVALGHPSMSGKASGSGTSGSTAWSNAVRSRLYLRYPKGIEKGNIRELEGMKLNYGPKGNLLKLRWSRGAFEVVAATVQGAQADVPHRAGATNLGTVEATCDAAVFDAVQGAPDAAMSLKPNSMNYAPKVLKMKEPDLLVAFGNEEIEAAIMRLLSRGALVEMKVGRDSARRPRMGYAAVPDKMSFNHEVGEASDAGVFE